MHVTVAAPSVAVTVTRAPGTKPLALTDCLRLLLSTFPVLSVLRLLEGSRPRTISGTWNHWSVVDDPLPATSIAVTMREFMPFATLG